MKMLKFAIQAALALCAAGCGGSIEQPFELVYLTYGRPDYPMGTLVHRRYEAGTWTELNRALLAHDAVLLHAPPYPAGVIPYISVIEAGGEKTSALWHWLPDSASQPQYQLPLTGRVVVMAAKHPTRDLEAICYYASGQINMVKAEYERRAVTLTANARCSLAVLDFDQPDSITPLSSCQFALPAWLPDGGLVFINRSNDLVRYDSLSATPAILVPQVKSFSVSATGKLCAVSLSGQLRFYTPSGEALGEPIDSAAVPLLSPDGRYLAHRHSDNDLWIRDLESETETEVGLGDPRNWSADSRLLLFYARSSDERGQARTLYRVAEAGTGVSIEIPQDGFLVDAVLVP